MTVAEKLYEEGWQKGQQEGRREGRHEGQRNAVLSALEARFGPIPAELRQRILSISDEDRLSEVLRLTVTSNSLPEVASKLP